MQNNLFRKFYNEAIQRLNLISTGDIRAHDVQPEVRLSWSKKLQTSLSRRRRRRRCRQTGKFFCQLWTFASRQFSLLELFLFWIFAWFFLLEATVHF